MIKSNEHVFYLQVIIYFWERGGIGRGYMFRSDSLGKHEVSHIRMLYLPWVSVITPIGVNSSLIIARIKTPIRSLSAFFRFPHR